MKTKNKIISILIFAVLITACNKSKKSSTRLDGSKWQVKDITIEGGSELKLPEVLFKECDIYEESCEGSWITPEGGRSSFIWQVRSKGKHFEISNQTDHVHGYLDVKAAEQCIKYTGVYNVVKSKRNKFIIESTVTSGYNGKKVQITFEK